MAKQNHDIGRCRLRGSSYISSDQKTRRYEQERDISQRLQDYRSLVLVSLCKDVHEGEEREDAYFMPTHTLEPRPNGVRYFSRRFRSVGSTQRSGEKVWGEGNISGFSWMNF
jgi:hypothetical protein